MNAQKGFTLIEVMTAVVVMTIGATGILAMQGASIHSNQDAFETAAAVNFGMTWLERIKRDARLWTTPGNADLLNTVYLRGLNDEDATDWFVPNPTLAGNEVMDDFESPAANYQGFDTLVTAANANNLRFCVNLKLTVAHAYNALTGSSVASTDADAVRVDVRVWWHRSSDDASRTRACAGALTALEIASPAIRKQYLSTVVRARAAGWP
jgi:prepilin-type N-terminal cleavage/methylation domain-containing protein